MRLHSAPNTAEFERGLDVALPEAEEKSGEEGKVGAAEGEESAAAEGE